MKGVQGEMINGIVCDYVVIFFWYSQMLTSSVKNVFLENIKMYVHFIPIFGIDMEPIVYIFPRERQRPK